MGAFLKTLAERTSEKHQDSGSRTNAAKARTAARNHHGRPEKLPEVTLSIVAHGLRMDADLSQVTPDGSLKRIASGSAHRPAFHDLLSAGQKLGTLGETARLGAMLSRYGFRDVLAALESLEENTIVQLSCSPETEALPWEWLVVSGLPLCLRNPVVRRPVMIGDKARGFPFVGQPFRALIISDTMAESSLGTALPGARDEGMQIAKILAGRQQTEDGSPENHVTLLLGAEATYTRVLQEVEEGDYDVIHFAGHASADERESFIALHDGFVRSSELVSPLNRRPPALMFLNSHVTAFLPLFLHRSQESEQEAEDWPSDFTPRGFTHMAARTGTGAFIGTFSKWLADETSASLAKAFYGHLMNGCPVAVALHKARKQVVTFEDVSGLFFSLSGYANVALRARCR